MPAGILFDTRAHTWYHVGMTKPTERRDLRVRDVSNRARLALHGTAALEGLTIGHLLDGLFGVDNEGNCPWPGCRHDHRWHVALRDGGVWRMK